MLFVLHIKEKSRKWCSGSFLYLLFVSKFIRMNRVNNRTILILKIKSTTLSIYVHFLCMLNVIRDLPMNKTKLEHF